MNSINLAGQMFFRLHFIIFSPAEAELFHVNGRTDRWIEMKKIIVAFGKSANAKDTTFLKDPFAYHR
jgi:hypothetical protein